MPHKFNKVTIINGPNLNLLGQRQPEIYGNQGFNGFFKQLGDNFPTVDLIHVQSNIEGEIVTAIQQYGKESAIILNAGGYTHTSVAIADAISGVGATVVEVHISNILAREPERSRSLIASACVGSISGLGLEGYRLALEFLTNGHENRS